MGTFKTIYAKCMTWQSTSSNGVEYLGV